MSVLLNVSAPATQAGTSVKYNDLGSQWGGGTDPGRTLFVDGTFGGATVVVEVSPDPLATPDASSRWHIAADGTATFTTPGMLNFAEKFKKIRARVSVAGTGTVTVEAL